MGKRGIIAIQIKKKNTLFLIFYVSRFKQKALERSKIIKDRPQTALDTAVYWIEYVLRHEGAKHLNPARAKLNLYQALSLDVAVFFFLLILILLAIIYKSIWLICSTAISLISPKIKKD